MEQVGDDGAGFSLGHDPSRNTLEVRAWGFWNADVAASFGVKVVAALRRAPGGKRLVLDVSDLKPMREEGQKSFADLFRSLSSLGVASASVVTTSQLTKLQLARIATASGAGALVQWLSGNLGPARDA
jgi:hypothetical protein